MYLTAESVSPKHPDKQCDIISDAILDACLKQDLNSRVAIETMGGHGIITVTGELTTNAYIDISKIVKSIVGNKLGVQVNVVSQSFEIAHGVDAGGAGDQGIMVGYACRENKEMIPQELYLARSLCKFIYSMYPEDGKTQITLEDGNKISHIVTSFNNVSAKIIKANVEKWLLFNNFKVAKDLKVFANPAGDWRIGSFEADTGLTGRKIVVDNYGPRISIGGGCYSGKDATKVDRTGAYYARYLAVKYLKERSNCKEVTVKIAFAIGVDKPVMITFETEDSGLKNVPIESNLLLSVKEMIALLDLKKPLFKQTAKWGAYGHKNNWDK